jgi:hypothetical protein
MTSGTPNTVQSLMERCLNNVRPSAVLLSAADQTAPGRRGPYRKKLTRDEAIAATKIVTAMIRRYGLKLF